MSLVVTITERTPTEDGRDINTLHIECADWPGVLKVIEEFWLNFGCLVVITITEV